MRLASITNWAYGATVALALTGGTTMLLASKAQEDERAAVAQRYALDHLTSSVGKREQLLSSHARQYVITGSAAELQAYERERKRLRSEEDRLRHMRDIGAGPDELLSLKEGIAIVDALQDEQQAAIEARARGDVNEAIALIFSPQYGAELDRAASLFEKFQYRLDQRTADEIASATRVARAWKAVSEGVLGATAFLFLFVLYFVFRKRVLQPVVKLSDVVTRLAADDFAAAPPEFAQIDEIGDMAQAIRIFRENGLARQRLEHERDEDRKLRDLLARMTQRMQASDTIDELEQVVSRFVPQIVRGHAGRLYLLDDARQSMVEACSWLNPSQSRADFSPLSCWALRRGSPHRVSGEQVDVPCGHMAADQPAIDTICLPLMAQRETFGLLYLEPRSGQPVETGASEIYLTMLAENIALAVANMRLRDALRSMAMADPLTGLANRRELESALRHELAESERTQQPLSCAMIDIDFFKQFNDEFGHDAGDAVLRAVGSVLRQSTREGSLAFRLGGEEFLVLMPALTADQARVRAEQIRTSVNALRVAHNGQELGPITASFGVASTPEICAPETLVETADAALLRAKQTGRDRVVLADIRVNSQVA